MEDKLNVVITLKDHEKRISKNENDINGMKVDNSSLTTKVTDLCDNMKSLTSTLRWGVGLLIPTLISLIALLVGR